MTTLDTDQLDERRRLLDRLLAGEGAGFIVHDLPVRSDGRTVASESRPWPVDPIPYRLSAADFSWIEGAVARRMDMLDAILDDLHGARRLVADGIVDPAMLWGSPRYRLAAASGWGRPGGGRRWLTTYSADIARTADGVWFLVADHTDGPSGLGYALLNRSVMSQVAGSQLDTVRPIDVALDLLRHGLVDTTELEGPRVAVFTGGIDHPSYVEHSYLATSLGFNLVEGSDLVVRDRRLWLQTLGGLEPIDVLFRQLGDAQLDPLEANARGSVGVPGVLLAASSDSVEIANAHGAGLIEDPFLRRTWDVAGRHLTGEEPWLRCPPEVSPDELGSGVVGLDAWLGRPAERVDVWPGLGDVRGAASDEPERGRRAAVVLRVHAIATADGVVVVPGATGRVLADTDEPRRPTPCRSKDVWVERDPEFAPTPIPAALHAPQVDLIASVPTRAADSLYWLGRAAERAEVVARACRVVSADRSTTAMHLLDALTGPTRLASAVPEVHAPLDDLSADEAIVASAGASIDFHVGSVLAEASGVREFLSATAGRVLAGLLVPRSILRERPLQIDAIDDLLTGLSALAGLWSESVVRGPAWYFGDFARRYERAVVAVTSAGTAMRCGHDPSLAPHERRHGLEAVLAVNDSLVAYRRRHRSDVELDTVLTLSLLDERNPRSARASLLGLERNAASIGWEPGAITARSLIDRLDALQQPADCEDLVEELHDLAARLHATELTAPPHPMLFRSAVTDPGAVA